MKAKNTTSILKTFILLIGFLVSSTTFAQTGKVWAQIDDFSSTGISIVKGKLFSENVEINNLITNLKINAIEKAFPASKSKKLQNVYEISCNCDENDLLQEIARKSILFKEPVIAPEYTSLAIPNDYSSVFANDYALNLINAQGAWDISEGDTSIVIAISDGNYYTNHEELIGKYTYVTPNNYSSEYYHGTAVATTAAGNTNNSLGKSSIGYNSRLQLRAMNYNQILEASYSGARIINVSWTSGCYFIQYTQDIMNEVYANGTVVIAAAGNGPTCGGSSNLVYPSALNHVISVSSVGPYDNHERYMGNPASAHQHNNTVDICAPGYDVALTVAPNWYLTGNGTSFAAPYVSGTVGLMLAANPCLTPDDVEFILKATAENIDGMNPAYIGLLGAGRLNAAAAVEMASTFNKLTINPTRTLDCLDYSQAVSLEIQDGIAPYTVNWSNNTTGIALSDITSGVVYTALIKDSVGCVGSYSLSFDEIVPMNLSADIYSVKCYGQNTGGIMVTVTGGVMNYTYDWNTNDSTQNLYSLTIGTYTLNVTDLNGCSITESFVITQPNEIAGTIIHQNVGFNQSGSIDLNVSGGVTPYNFEWNNGVSSEDLNGIFDGFYEVEIIDANGCFASANVIILNIEYAQSNDFLINSELDTPNLESGETTMGISEMNVSDVSIYPNPAIENTTVVWGEMDVNLVQVYDMTGKVVNTIEIGSTQNSIQINGISTGEYFVKLITTNGDQMVKKVIFL